MAAKAFAGMQEPGADTAHSGGLRVASDAFAEGGMIPDKHAYAGGNVSPSIWWDGLPKGAKTVAIICDDPDAPNGAWIHWVIFNIPAAAGLITEGIPRGEVLPSGLVQGVNDFGNNGYDGPAPPSGTHRYYFRVYALDAAIDLKPGSTAKELLAAMESHVLAQGSIMGRYGGNAGPRE